MRLILLEDDAVILMCTQEALTEAGFEVLPATRGSEALALLSKFSNVVAMVIDVNLAEAPDGWEVARLARQILPDVMIIYTTTAGGLSYKTHGVERSVLLEKPYTLECAVSAARAAATPDQ